MGEVSGNQDGRSITNAAGGTRRKRRALGTSPARTPALGQLRAQRNQAVLSTARTAKQPLGSTEQEPERCRQDSAKQVSLGPPLNRADGPPWVPGLPRCRCQTPLPPGAPGLGRRKHRAPSAGAAELTTKLPPQTQPGAHCKRVGKKRNDAVGVNTNFIIQYLKSHFSTCPLIACIVLQLIC